MTSKNINNSALPNLEVNNYRNVGSDPGKPSTPVAEGSNNNSSVSSQRSAGTPNSNLLAGNTGNSGQILVVPSSHSVIGSRNALSGSGPVRLTNSVTFIECGRLRFLIMDAPTDSSLPIYLQEMLKHHVTDVVRVCNPTYSTRSLAQNNIQVHDWPFDDGEAPPYNIVDHWLQLIDERFPVVPKDQKTLSDPSTAHDSLKKSEIASDKHPSSVSTSGTRNQSNEKNSHQINGQQKPSIAVHCVAGLGRAPVLAAIALIEDGMSALDSVAFIRDRRRGAINNKQLKFLEQYKRRRRHSGKCIVM